MSKRIFITGAFGSGKSTLAKALASNLALPYIEGDELRWDNGRKRSDEEFELLQKQAIENNKSFIYEAGHLKHATNQLIQSLTSVVFVDTPAEECYRRVKQRDGIKHGARVLEGGDYYEQHQKFLNDIKNYDITEKGYGRKKHEEFLQLVQCPVIKVNGTNTPDENIAAITQQLNTQSFNK